MMCSRCNKNVAVIFVSKVDGNSQSNEGLCFTCAKELGIKPLEDMMQSMGIEPEQMDSTMTDIMKEAADEEIPKTDSAGRAPSPIEMLNRLFSKSADEGISPQREEFRQQKQRTEEKQKAPPKKRKSLDTYGISLTQKAKDGLIDRIIGREREIARVIQILNRRTKNNPVLLGEPGVGKTAIAEGLALKIAQKQVPAKLFDYEVYLVDFAAMVAGTQFRGQFEGRMKALLDEVKALGNIILVIDEVHNIVGAGEAEGAMNAANILKPSLSRGEIQVIGATTLNEYRKTIEKDTALERRFQPVIVDEPTIEESIEIVKGIKDYYEKYHKVSIGDEICRAAVILSERYIHDRFLPDKAIDVIDEASSKVNLGNMGLLELAELKSELSTIQQEKENAIMSDSIEDYQKAADLKITECRVQERINELESKYTHIPVTAEDIALVIEQWTKIPVQRLSEFDTQRLLNLEQDLHKRVIGQNKAVEAVSRSIRRRRAGIAPKRPVSFLFVGPTGVGKTELVKALAESLFGSEQALIRVDMSEYMEKHSVSKLIGSPPGYVGYDEAGQLTEKIRRNPYSVVLFDEIEKAHGDVVNILLQVFDDGRITDSHGRTVNFENTVIVMTSNAGSELKSGAMGFEGVEAFASKYDKTLKELFRPEFLNRVDEIVEFTSLSKEELEQIIELLATELRKQLNEQGISLEITQSAKELLLTLGYDPKYGARPLRRVLQRKVEDPAADKILRGDVKNGGVITVDAVDGEIVLE